MPTPSAELLEDVQQYLASDECSSLLADLLSKDDRKKLIAKMIEESTGLSKAKAKLLTLVVDALLVECAKHGKKTGVKHVSKALKGGHAWLYGSSEWYRNFADSMTRRFLKSVYEAAIGKKTLQGLFSEPTKALPVSDDDRKWIELFSQLNLLVARLEGLQASCSLKRNAPLLPDLNRPTSLLEPDSCFIADLVGRETEKASLLAFVDDPVDFRYAALIGEGGSGKTRLALDLCMQVIEQGWEAGFLSADALKALVGHPQFSSWVPSGECLIVVDYAQSSKETLSTLFCRLVSLAGSGEMEKVRLLLLERHAKVDEGWLSELSTALEGPARTRGVGMSFYDLWEIPTYTQKEDADFSFVKGMIDATLAAWSGLSSASRRELPQWTEEQWVGLAQRTEQRPLCLLIAGLQYAEAGDEQKLREANVQMLLDYAVDKELAHLGKVAEHCGVKKPAHLFYAAALVTLAGPHEYYDDAFTDALNALAKKLGEDSDALRHPLDEGLGRTAQEGEQGDGAEHVVVPIGPDLVAGAFVESVLKRDKALREYVLQSALELNAFHAWHKLWLFGCDAEARTEAGQNLYGCWLEVLIDRQERFEAVLPLEPFVVPFSTTIHKVRTAYARKTITLVKDSADESVRVGFLNNAAKLLVETGNHQEAASVAKGVVERVRKLASANSSVYTPSLALSLNNYANILSGIGNRDEAVVAAKEAVESYRKLAAANSAAYAPDLAMSLNNYANRLSETGNRDEAVVAAKEAVESCRKLAAANSAAYKPDLAMSLNNYANRLSETGNREEAVVAAKEAVESYRKLAAANSAAYTPALASSLNNYANHLSETGHREEAVVVAKEAVDIRRKLATANPAAYTPDLAMSLTTYANRLSETGSRDEAVFVAKEAVDIRRKLAAANPAAYLPYLASSLNNYANRLSETGNREEAVVVAKEAVDIRRKLAAANPAAYMPDLASSLNNYANRLSETGNREEAVVVAKEAVEIYRKLASVNPAAYTPALATSLNNYASMLSKTGNREEAVFVAKEAVDIWRKLAAANPAAYTPDLATSCGALGSVFAVLEQPDRAAKSFLEGMQRLAPLFMRHPYFDQLMFSLSRDYIKSCQVAEVALCRDVLGPILKTLSERQPELFERLSEVLTAEGAEA
jgi:HEPN domain-containing protein